MPTSFSINHATSIYQAHSVLETKPGSGENRENPVALDHTPESGWNHKILPGSDIF